MAAWTYDSALKNEIVTLDSLADEVSTLIE